MLVIFGRKRVGQNFLKCVFDKANGIVAILLVRETVSLSVIWELVNTKIFKPYWRAGIASLTGGSNKLSIVGGCGVLKVWSSFRDCCLKRKNFKTTRGFLNVVASFKKTKNYELIWKSTTTPHLNCLAKWL